MKINKKFYIYSVLAIFIIIGVYFSVTSFNILGDNDKQMFDDMSCNVPIDCYNEFIDVGFPKADLDAELIDAELICESNICGVQLK
jgi:hypothetical protein